MMLDGEGQLQLFLDLMSRIPEKGAAMNRYKILKSSPDGISGGESKYDSIDEVLREISHHRGWDSKEQLHESIRQWAKHAKPGDIFTTQVTAIVAVAINSVGSADGDCCIECGHEGLDYREFEWRLAEGLSSSDGKVTQQVSCPACGLHWVDVFALVDREIVGGKRKSTTEA